MSTNCLLQGGARVLNNMFMDIWNIVDQRLVAMRLKDVDFANSLGESPQTISNWRKRGIPSIKYGKIAKFLGIPVDDLYGVGGQVRESDAVYDAPSVDGLVSMIARAPSDIRPRLVAELMRVAELVIFARGDQAPSIDEVSRITEADLRASASKVDIKKTGG